MAGFMIEHEYFVDDCTGWLLLKWNGVRIKRTVLSPILDFCARGSLEIPCRGKGPLPQRSGTLSCHDFGSASLTINGIGFAGNPKDMSA